MAVSQSVRVRCEFLDYLDCGLSRTTSAISVKSEESPLVSSPLPFIAEGVDYTEGSSYYPLFLEEPFVPLPN